MHLICDYGITGRRTPADHLMHDDQVNHHTCAAGFWNIYEILIRRRWGRSNWEEEKKIKRKNEKEWDVKASKRTIIWPAPLFLYTLFSFFFLFYDSYITNRPCTLQLCPRHSIIFPSWIVRRLINVPTCLINSRLVPTELGLTTLLPSLINLYDLKNNFIVVTHYYF